MLDLRTNNRAGKWDLNICEVGNQSIEFQRNLTRDRIFRSDLSPLASACQEPDYVISAEKFNDCNCKHDSQDFVLFLADLHASLIISSIFTEKYSKRI
jgi:hypothetical protein